MKLSFKKIARIPGQGLLIKLFQKDLRYHNNNYKLNRNCWVFIPKHDYPASAPRLVLSKDNRVEVFLGNRPESLLNTQIIELILEEAEQFRLGDISKAEKIRDNFEALFKILNPN